MSWREREEEIPKIRIERVAELEREIESLRETNRRLNRRVQRAESENVRFVKRLEGVLWNTIQLNQCLSDNQNSWYHAARQKCICKVPEPKHISLFTMDNMWQRWCETFEEFKIRRKP